MRRTPMAARRPEDARVVTRRTSPDGAARASGKRSGMDLRQWAPRVIGQAAGAGAALGSGCSDDEQPRAAAAEGSNAYVEVGSTATLGGLQYTPVPTRQLNPSMRPDPAILEGVDVDRTGGQLLVAVVLRGCNESGRPRTSTTT